MWCREVCSFDYMMTYKQSRTPYGIRLLFLLCYKVFGVKVLAVLAYLEVEVVSCGITCAAHISDKLTCLDIVAYLCGKLCLMGIYGNISVVILDNDAVSVAAVPACACIGNCSACGSVNGRAVGSCYVDALVVSSVALV